MLSNEIIQQTVVVMSASFYFIFIYLVESIKAKKEMDCSISISFLLATPAETEYVESFFFLYVVYRLHMYNIFRVEWVGKSEI